MDSSNILGVEPLTGIILCVPCKFSTNCPRTARAHLIQKDGVSPATATDWTNAVSDKANAVVEQNSPLRQKYIDAPFALEHPLPVLPMLPVTRGYQCSLCPFCTSDMKYLRKHILTDHAGCDADDMIVRLEKQGTIPLQTLCSGGKARRYFPVILPTNYQSAVESENGDVDLSDFLEHLRPDFLSTFENVPHFEGDQPSSRKRHLNDFIAQTKYDQILRDMNISIDAAVVLSGYHGDKDETEKHFVQDTKSYLQMVPSILLSSSPGLAEALSLKENRPFSTVDSVDRYSLFLSRLLVSCYRFFKAGKLHPHLICSVKSYMSCNGSEKERISLLHNILKNILLESRSSTDGTKWMFVRTFLSCACVIGYPGKLRYSEATEMSHLLAAIQYGIRCVLVHESRDIFLQKQEFNRIGKDIPEEWDTHFDDLVSQCSDKRANSVASYIRLHLNMCMKIVAATPGSVCFETCKDHDLCAYISSVELGMAEIGKLVVTMNGDTMSILTDNILGGCPLPKDFTSVLALLSDNLQDQKVGSNFLHQSCYDKVQKWPVMLLESLKNNRNRRFTLFLDDDAIEDDLSSGSGSPSVSLASHTLSRKGMQTFLREAQKMQELLLCCMHFGSGGPSRATEISTLRLSTGAKGKRNLYLGHNSTLMMRTRYCKQRALLGTDRHVLRILDPQTNKSFLLYLCMVRPLEVLFTKLLFGEQAAQRHQEFMFVQRGTPFSPDHIRQIIKSKLHHIQKPLSLSDYRQWASGMNRELSTHFSSKLMGDVAKAIEDIGMKQANHGASVTDSRYGRTASVISDMGVSDTERNRMYSQMWHSGLGLVPKPRRAATAPPTPNSRVPINTKEQDAFLNKLGLMMDKKFETFLSTEKSSVNKRIHRQLEGSFSPLPISKRMKSSLSENSAIKPCTRAHPESDSKILIPALMRFVPSTNGRFLSQAQQDVTAFIYEAKEDIVALMPTGSGKTLCFLLPVAMEGPDACTVVIVPLFALLEDLITRCERMNIKAGTWNDRSTLGIQVFVVCVEQTVRTEFKDFIGLLHRQRRLRRIVLDECHCYTMWDDFRPHMAAVKHALFLPEPPIQRVLLSATIPIPDRPRVLASLGMRTAILKHVPCVRDNVSMVVEVLESHNFVETCMIAKIKQVLTKLVPSLEAGSRIMIFAFTLTELKDISDGIKDLKARLALDVLTYHGKLSAAEKQECHKLWTSTGSSTNVQVVVCTNAFGAGVDVPNVRLVIHFGGSSSLVNYVQESGRAGRDGKPATSVVVFNDKYASKRTSLVERKLSEATGIQREYRQRELEWWRAFVAWASQSHSCRRNQLSIAIDGADSGLCLNSTQVHPCDVCCSIAPDLDALPHTPSKPPLPVMAWTSSETHTPSARRYSSPSADRLSTPSLTRRQIDFGGPTTAAVNTLGARMDKKYNNEQVNQFMSVVNHISGICIRCLVYDGKERPFSSANRNFPLSCKHCTDRKLFSCYSCGSTEHRSNGCSSRAWMGNKRWKEGHCPGCTMGNWDGVSSHNMLSLDFGKKCRVRSATMLAWALWWSPEHRQSLLSEMATGADSNKLQTVCSAPNIDDMAKAFSEWLHDDSRIPRVASIAIWWGEKNNVL